VTATDIAGSIAAAIAIVPANANATAPPTFVIPIDTTSFFLHAQRPRSESWNLTQADK
jgi:hypothetical protein